MGLSTRVGPWNRRRGCSGLVPLSGWQHCTVIVSRPNEIGCEMGRETSMARGCSLTGKVHQPMFGTRPETGCRMTYVCSVCSVDEFVTFEQHDFAIPVKATPLFLVCCYSQFLRFQKQSSQSGSLAPQARNPLWCTRKNPSHFPRYIKPQLSNDWRTRCLSAQLTISLGFARTTDPYSRAVNLRKASGGRG